MTDVALWGMSITNWSLAFVESQWREPGVAEQAKITQNSCTCIHNFNGFLLSTQRQTYGHMCTAIFYITGRKGSRSITEPFAGLHSSCSTEDPNTALNEVYGMKARTLCALVDMERLRELCNSNRVSLRQPFPFSLAVNTRSRRRPPTENIFIFSVPQIQLL